MEILDFIDQLPEATKRDFFPNLQEFISGHPDSLIPLLAGGISRDKITRREQYAGVEYRFLGHGDIWNSIALTYMNKGDFQKAIDVFNYLEKAGASDSATQNNIATVILNRMISKHIIDQSDEQDFERAKNLLYKAFMFDVKAKPRRNIADAALFPAFKNMILVRNIESELYYNKRMYFLAFVLGWISVEMSLVRIWCQIMSNHKGERDVREKLSQLDAQTILDLLFGLNVIPIDLYSKIKGIKDERNKLIHGTMINPTKGKTMELITLGRRLIPILSS